MELAAMKKLITLKLFVIFALLFALSPLNAFAKPGAETPKDNNPGKMHQLLKKKAKEKPDALVEVIVQMEQGKKLKPIDLPEGSLKKKDMDWMGGVLLRLPLKQIEKLAQNPHVKLITPNAPLRVTSAVYSETTYPLTTGVADTFWNSGFQGGGVGVAVLDSGISAHKDLAGSKVDIVVPDNADLGTDDLFGHGTHVAGIIAGDSGDGRYVGVAPKATVYNIKVSDDNGMARESDLIDGLEWIYYNHDAYNIRVVNISMQSTLAQSYKTSPISAAIEQLWFEGIVVVVSAGNNGSAVDVMNYPPANDPFVITVGALDEQGTADRSDDVMADFSSRGLTQDKISKPDILAPGRQIVAPLAANSHLQELLPDRITDNEYIRLSGTSMAAPVVSGIAASILSNRPELTNNQVKWLITNQTYGNAGIGMLDAEALYATLNGEGYNEASITKANQGTEPNKFFIPQSGGNGETNVYFENVYFENVYFENVYFENVYFENVYFENVFFD
jgi:serine protease AprX